MFAFKKDLKNNVSDLQFTEVCDFTDQMYAISFR